MFMGQQWGRTYFFPGNRDKGDALIFSRNDRDKWDALIFPRE